MSWYTVFYIGLMAPDKTIKPLGPYDANGELKHVICTPRSFTTELKDEFYPIEAAQLTEKLCEEFPYETEDKEEGKIYSYFGYLPFDELPKDSFMRSGYYLAENIKEYLENPSMFDGFYESLTPIEYAFKLENELKFGPPKSQTDEDGYEVETHSCADYQYFCYPDYNCAEYEAWMLRHEASILISHWEIPEGHQLVVIKTEG